MRSSALLCHRTPRLELMVDLTKEYESIADIGCDHAYLSVMLAQCGKRVIASDVACGPHAKARENIERFGLAGQIDLRLGDGLLTLAPEEVQAVVIAGMGGLVIADILKEGKYLLTEQMRLFLQPMRADEELRTYLYKNGFKILSEHLVREQRRIYTVMEVWLGKQTTNSALDSAFSPALRQEKPPLFWEYFSWKKRILEGIIRNTANAENAELKKEFEQKLLAYTLFEKENGNAL